jgi:hypothetical protein
MICSKNRIVRIVLGISTAVLCIFIPICIVFFTSPKEVQWDPESKILKEFTLSVHAPSSA